MKLYNTLTRQINEVTPLQPPVVRMYSCGPTVYNNIHIGNLSSFIFADTLRRTISANGQPVQHVMNFTDVDDKTIRRSHELYPDLDAMPALLKLTGNYSQVFLDDMQTVGNDIAAMQFVKATDSIEAMQSLITELFDAKIAYIADDGVYFSIEAYQANGKTYGQLTEITTNSTSEARINNDEYDKDSAHDFALWKLQKDGEPAWPFILGGKQVDGRPGWHIECSAMSHATLGTPFDIHTGGIDLIFPHHENEIAQSTAVGDSRTYATHFAHNEHMLIDGKKMSKSLNNFYTLEDITKQGYDPLAFRLLVLQSHYRNQAHFTWKNLAAAQNRLKELRAMAVLRYQALPVVHDAATFSLEDVPLELRAILAEDLSTPQALAYLSNITTQLLAVLIEEDMVDHFEVMLQGIDAVFGLQLQQVPDITPTQKQVIADRREARANKDWSLSDTLRDQLVEHGIGLRDRDEATIWYHL